MFRTLGYTLLLVVTTFGVVRCGPLSPSIAKSTQAPGAGSEPSALQDAPVTVRADAEPTSVELEYVSEEVPLTADVDGTRISVFDEDDSRYDDYQTSGEFEIEVPKGKIVKRVFVDVPAAVRKKHEGKDKPIAVHATKVSDGKWRVKFSIEEKVRNVTRSITIVFE